MGLYQKLKNKKEKLAVVGLGYVGLPLAIEFGKAIETIGFDLNKKRILELKDRLDSNHEISSKEIKSAALLELSADPEKLKQSKFIIVSVPTPITRSKQPDLSSLSLASKIVGENLTPKSIVVFESTVYPGATEDICIPILEKNSQLKFGKDFKVGYSPERINPGDKKHNINNIIKVVSGCDKQALDEIAKVYGLIVKAGIYKAEFIKVAEAAKVIENTQRDLNIALMNELAIIFHKLGIDTLSVLKAASTKWNFISMYPGLVGGHCIGVDPYYLTHKAEETGYHPQVILAGRRINDNMGKFVAQQTIRLLIEAKKTVRGARVLVLGLTFKENISDIRNSKAIDIISELRSHDIKVIVCDPLADKQAVRKEYGINLTEYSFKIKVDAVIIAVGHSKFKKVLKPAVLKRHLKRKGSPGVVVDVKGIFQKDRLGKHQGLIYWRL